MDYPNRAQYFAVGYLNICVKADSLSAEQLIAEMDQAVKDISSRSLQYNSVRDNSISRGYRKDYTLCKIFL